ncbi:jg20056 [Pararge aegeria aegeria]|uniref:Jg20056 protein n=1 Tax=Pararge aegeria aegeria TaxID=348720 RepID=A0A8S4RD40_9NEOP|nr:jg20056 [Pararge aegeria aegeria]
MNSRYRVQVRGERRATESELHKKGYKTMAMNASEPEPCEPLAGDAARRRQHRPASTAQSPPFTYISAPYRSRFVIFKHIFL